MIVKAEELKEKHPSIHLLDLLRGSSDCGSVMNWTFCSLDQDIKFVVIPWEVKGSHPATAAGSFRFSIKGLFNLGSDLSVYRRQQCVMALSAVAKYKGSNCVFLG